jgi:hypothetical protein
VLLDVGSGVYIIFESLRKKLGLRRLQLAPFCGAYGQPMEDVINWFD